MRFPASPLQQPALVRWLLLVLLVVQTSLMVLILRYSRTTTTTPYLASTVVLFTECLKFVLCLLLLLWQRRCSPGLTATVFRQEVLWRPGETARLAVPASLYTLQNNLLILALTNLDAATYQVTYQLKILTTAVFSVLLMGKRLTFRQWVSLVLLTIGVVLVQVPVHQAAAVDSAGRDQVVGLVAVLTACFSSGFAGVYYEKLVKESSQPSLVIRNLQLGLFSLFFAAAGMLLNDWELIRDGGKSERELFDFLHLIK